MGCKNVIACVLLKFVLVLISYGLCYNECM